MGPSWVALIWGLPCRCSQRGAGGWSLPKSWLGSTVQDGLFTHMAGASAALWRMDTLSLHMVFPYVWLELSHSLVFSGNQTSYMLAGLSQRKYPKKPKQKLYSFLRPNFGSHVPFRSILLVRREFIGPTQSQGQGTTQRWEFWQTWFSGFWQTWFFVDRLPHIVLCASQDRPGCGVVTNHP